MLTLATLETVTYGDSFPIFDIDIDVIDLAVDAIYFEVDAEIDAVGDVDFGLGIDFGVGDVNVGDVDVGALFLSCFVLMCHFKN